MKFPDVARRALLAGASLDLAYPAPELMLSDEATAQLIELCRLNTGHETGGLLIGTSHGGIAFVWAITGHGPNALLRQKELRIDSSYLMGIMAGVSVAGIVEVLGRWHKHVAPDLRASEDDRRGAEAFRLLADVPRTFELIVGTHCPNGEDEPVGFGAYLCTDGALQRIECRT